MHAYIYLVYYIPCIVYSTLHLDAAANNHLMASMNMQKEWPPPTRKAKDEEKRGKRKSAAAAAYILGHNAELSKKHPNLKALSELLLLLAGYLG